MVLVATQHVTANQKEIKQTSKLKEKKQKRKEKVSFTSSKAESAEGLNSMDVFFQAGSGAGSSSPFWCCERYEFASLLLSVCRFQER